MAHGPTCIAGIVSLAGIAVLAQPLKADVVRFPMALCETADGTVWAGTDGDGLWYSNVVTKAWVRDARYGGVGGDCSFCLYEDSNGCLWSGSLSEGPCVYNGQEWRSYPLESGFLGSRVFSIAGSSDGSVWVASDGGLARYSSATDSWRFWTRDDGLPENEIMAVACDNKGRVYLGHATAGVSIGDSADDYSQWRTVSAPWKFKGGKYEVPPAEKGVGLPSNLLNCLMVHADGTVFAGTLSGLAISTDRGDNWSFIRAKDYYKYLGQNETPALERKGRRLLLDDYVSSLTPLGETTVLICGREGGTSVYDIRRRTVLQDEKREGEEWITSSIRLRDGRVLLGTYGGGIVQSTWKGTPIAVAASRLAQGQRIFPRTPIEATDGRRKGSLNVQSSGHPPAFYLRDDWETKGDWWGRYGLRDAILCAMYAQWGDFECVNAEEADYLVKGWIGPNARKFECRRNWLHWIVTDNPNSLWLPVQGIRRQAEWDDYGETYGRYFNGPDLTVQIQMPKGVHDIALYFFNKDGHDGQNRRRDYLIEMSRIAPDKTPVLARARVKDFWNGVYKVFRVNEEGTYFFRIRRQGSFATILSGVFIQGAHEVWESVEEPFMNTASYMGGVVYQEPLPTFNGNPASKLAIACTNAVRHHEKAVTGKTFDWARFGLARIYAASVKRMDSDTNEHLRWRMRRWSKADKEKFNYYTKLIWAGVQIKCWWYILRKNAKYSKNTVDSLEDLNAAVKGKHLLRSLDDWIEAVPPERREYVVPPSSNFWERAALTRYHFRPPVSECEKEDEGKEIKEWIP